MNGCVQTLCAVEVCSISRKVYSDKRKKLVYNRLVVIVENQFMMIIIDHYPYRAIQDHIYKQTGHRYCKVELGQLKTNPGHRRVEGLNLGSSEYESSTTTTQPHGLQ